MMIRTIALNYGELKDLIERFKNEDYEPLEAFSHNPETKVFDEVDANFFAAPVYSLYSIKIIEKLDKPWLVIHLEASEESMEEIQMKHRYVNNPSENYKYLSLYEKPFKEILEEELPMVITMYIRNHREKFDY